MEKLTNSKRSNWMYSNENNHSTFIKYASNVFVDYSSQSKFSGKKLCISNLYEEFHFSEMMNIVSELAKIGVRYTPKPYKCDIFVTYNLKNKKNEDYECYRFKKAISAVENQEKEITFISFDELMETLNLNEKYLSTLSKDSLTSTRKKALSKA
jgi:hypothetical protein